MSTRKWLLHLSNTVCCNVDLRGPCSLFTCYRTNMDELTLLDVATMLNHTEVALLLLKHGVQENQKCKEHRSSLLAAPHLSLFSVATVSHRAKHLQTLIDASQTKLAELTLAASKQTGSSTASVATSATLSKVCIRNLRARNAPGHYLVGFQSLDKQISSCESRLHTLKKMQKNLETSGMPNLQPESLDRGVSNLVLGLPGGPRNVSLSVSSSASLSVTFEPPEQTGIVVTKYKSKCLGR